MLARKWIGPLIISGAIGSPLFALSSESNLEDHARDWSLVQYEATFGSLRLQSLRRVGQFRNCNLRGLRAISLRLLGFDFYGSDLRGADFTNADVRGVDFRASDLRESVFVSTREEGALFDQKTRLPFPLNEALTRGWVKVEP